MNRRLFSWASVATACLLCACHPSDQASTALDAANVDQQLCVVAGPPQAVGELEKASERARLRPDRAERWADVGWAWHELAEQSGDAGYYLSMAACAKAATAIDPKLSSAIELIALSHLHSHRFAAARDQAQELLASDPNNALAAGVLSDAELELGNYSKSKSAAIRQLELAPGLPARTRLAHLAWLHGDIGAALAHMSAGLREGAAERARRMAWALGQTADIYFSQGDRPRARQLYLAALDRYSRSRAALHGLAKVALAEQDGFQARAWLARIPASPELGQTLFLMSLSYQIEGDLEHAMSWFDRALERARTDDPVMAAKLLSRNPRQAERAVAILTEELRTRSGVNLESALAWAQFQSGLCAAGLERVRHAHRLHTPDPDLIWIRGTIESRCGEVVEGQRLRQLAESKDPLVSLRHEPPVALGGDA